MMPIIYKGKTMRVRNMEYSGWQVSIRGRRWWDDTIVLSTSKNLEEAINSAKKSIDILEKADFKFKGDA